MLPEWLMTLLVLLQEAWSARRDDAAWDIMAFQSRAASPQALTA